MGGACRGHYLAQTWVLWPDSPWAWCLSQPHWPRSPPAQPRRQVSLQADALEGAISACVHSKARDSAEVCSLLSPSGGGGSIGVGRAAVPSGVPDGLNVASCLETCASSDPSRADCRVYNRAMQAMYIMVRCKLKRSLLSTNNPPNPRSWAMVF